MKINILSLMVLLVFGCTKVAPRRPIQPKPSTTILNTIIKEAKALNQQEDTKIEAIIAQDSTTVYHLSSHGFWYTYQLKKADSLPSPKLGDLIQFEYEIYDLNDGIIYSKQELGIKNYQVDKEDMIAGIQNGVKLMKAGETVTFLIPSYNAFGIAGDKKRIEMNQSIKSKVTLLKIN